MIGIVVVSHSRALAQAAVALAQEMVHGGCPAIAIAAGLDAETLGTDAMAVADAIRSVCSDDGVVVLMDLGSAVLSTDLALDLLEPAVAEQVEVTPAPLVEGLVAAVVQAAAGGTRAQVVAEAMSGLAGKQAHFGTSESIEADPGAGSIDASAVFDVLNAHGLHARPAARLVGEVNRFNARARLTNLTSGVGPVNAASLSRVAALGAVKGHQLEIAAAGPPAADLVTAIVGLAGRHFDDVEPVREVARAQLAPSTSQPASPGIGIGPKFTLASVPLEFGRVTSEDAAAEWRHLREALAAVRTEIARVKLRVYHDVGEEDAEIFEAHLMLLEDRAILDTVRSAIDSGAAAPHAWRSAVDDVAAEWAGLDDPYLNARAADVRALRDQVLRYLLGADGRREIPEGILVAEDLSPAETADLDPGSIKGIVTAYGSATSHSAILARSLGIPAVVGAGRWVLDIADGDLVTVNGTSGEVVANPSDRILEEYTKKAKAEAEQRRAAEENAHTPAVTIDGLAVDVESNVASLASTEAALRAGADGVGLLRTEFLFMDRRTPPDIDEQEAVYRSIATALDGRRLVIRTLDVGGDKPLSYAPTPAEANPFLGARGIRFSLQNRTLFDNQLTAICRVASDHPVAVMFPMVTNVDEVVTARLALAKVAADEGVPPDSIEVGIMVEVPSVALRAEAFAPHVDFFSIGTNDLTQYTLASERGNESVAHLADAVDPAVLRLIDMVCRSAESSNVRVAVCGEVAADPVAVPLLVGMGVRQLSVSAPSVGATKEVLRSWSATRMRELAAQALGLASASDVRELVTGSRPG